MVGQLTPSNLFAMLWVHKQDVSWTMQLEGACHKCLVCVPP
jgi:hypothetical protein